jgi:phenylacetate-CoA ligase
MKNLKIKDFNLGTRLNGLKHAFVKKALSPWKKYAAFLDESQWWSANDLQRYQENELQRIIQLANKNVPYYRGAMQVFGVKPKNIQSLADLALMPFVEKETLRKHATDFLSRKSLSPALYKCHTSGTTGTPLTLYRDLRNIGFEYAMLRRQRLWAGLDDSDRYATLKGELLPESRINQFKYWQMNSAEHKLVLSSYHISEKTAERYVEALHNYQPVAIDGYPSSIYTLAKMMLQRGLTFPMKAILTSSETLAPEQKAIIETVFQCRVFDYYGMAERIAAIHTCEHGSYHVVPEYSIVEFIRNPLFDGYFEIVGTSLNNNAMPLIRYRVGDIAELSKETCACGRHYPVIKSIVGRTDDSIITPSGKVVGRLDHIFKGINNLVQAQIYQPRQDKIILRVVPDSSFSKSDGEVVLEKLYHRVGDGIQFEIERVPEIGRTPRGKIKSVVSDVI